MGKKSKRKASEDPGCDVSVAGRGTQGDDQQTEGAATTPSKRSKKHKNSKEEDRDLEQQHPAEQCLGTVEQNTDKTEKKKKKKKKRKAAEDSDVEEGAHFPELKKRKLGSEEDDSEKASSLECAGDCSADVAEAVRNGHCEKEKKKKKKKSCENEELTVSATDTTVNGSISQPEELIVDMSMGDSNTTKSGKTCKKHKKEKKKKSKQDASVTGGCDPLLSETDPQGVLINSFSQKKKTGKSEQQSEEEGTPLQDDSQVGTTEEDSTPKGGKKKKKKHKRSRSELDAEATENGAGEAGSQAQDTDPCDPRTERTKEKKAKLTAAENEGGGAASESNSSSKDSKENKREKKKKKKERSEEGTNPAELPSCNCEDANCETIKKTSEKKEKRKKSQGVEENTDKTEHTAVSDVIVDQAAETKEKKKKKKSRRVEEDKPEHIAASSDVIMDQAAETKEEEEEEEKKMKKKKRKSKEKERKPEQQGLATGGGGEACNGNAETADRKGMDVASSPVNPGEAETDPGQVVEGGDAGSSAPATLGQWSTAMFKDSQRQSKFLRLLGGFRKAGDTTPAAASGPKKGLFGSLQLQQQDSSADVGGQRALTYEAAQAMHRRLESDYERALTFSARGQRGVGLGFTPDPAEGKKFHIDVNRVASKQFD